MPNFGEIIWDHDIPDMIRDLKKYGYHEFTISSTFSGLIHTIAELEKMGRWSLNIYTMPDRRAYASDAHDYQPLPEWHDNYNSHLRPWMPFRRGIGFTFIDPSRREEEYMHLHSSGIDKEDYERIKAKRQAQIIMARKGIAPDNYGEDDRDGK